MLNIRDFKPGMSSINIRMTISEILETKQVLTGKGAEHEIFEARAEDKTCAMTLVLWNEKTLPLNVGDILQIENGFVTSFKGEWRINV